MSMIRRTLPDPSAYWLAVLSAVIVPVFIEIAATHRGHWGLGLTGFWMPFVVSWAARIWALLMVVGLAGWAGGIGAEDPRLYPRLAWSAGAAAAGWLLIMLSAVPGWVWLGRLTGAGVEVAWRAGLATLPVLLSAIIAGPVGRLVGDAGGALAGGVVGSGLLWLVWGLLG